MTDDPEFDDAIRAAEVTVETLTDEMVREFFVDLEPGDPMRIQCSRAVSTDSTRRYEHESTDDFWRRKQYRSDARQRICNAINARLRRSTP